MPDHPLPLVPVRPVSSLRALVWLAHGLRLWRRAPVALLLLSLAPFVVEGGLQLIPLVGVVLSKVVVLLLHGGLWLGVDELQRGGRLRAACLVQGFARERWRPLLGLSAWMLAIFATQVLVATVVYGPAALGVAVGRLPAELHGKSFMLLLILSGALPAVLLMLSMPFVLFDHLGPARAVALSLRFALAAKGAFAAFTLVTMALLAVSLLLGGLPLLAVAPWLLGASYAAYRDMRAG